MPKMEIRRRDVWVQATGNRRKRQAVNAGTAEALGVGNFRATTTADWFLPCSYLMQLLEDDIVYKCYDSLLLKLFRMTKL